MLELKVRNQTYRIDLVSMYVLEKYDEMQADAVKLTEAQIKQNILNSELSGYVSDLKQIVKIPDETALEELKKKIEIVKSQVEKCAKSITEISRELFEKRKEIVKEILESNDYEYDDAFWHRRTSPEDMNEFLLCCVNKDREPDTKKSSVKKKVIQSSDEND